MSEIQPWAREPWVETLRRAVRRFGLSEVAERLGCSTATVSLLRNGTYSSPIEKWRERVLAEFERDVVDCPVLGEITPEECRFHRTRSFGATNPTRVRLARTCPTCPNNPDCRLDYHD